jgi:hypothetical protein
MIQSGSDRNAYAALPVNTGPLDLGKDFVHVFDKISLEVLILEISTLKDFIGYLGACKAGPARAANPPNDMPAST